MSRKESEVWQACDDLLAMGKTPREITGEAIGNRLRELDLKPGSLTYRYRYRDSWMEERGLTRESSEIDAKPTDIIERSAAIFRKTIEEGIREEYEIKYETSKKEVEEAGLRYEACNQALERTTQDRERLKESLADVQKTLEANKASFLIEREKRIQFETELRMANESSEHQRIDFEKRLLEFQQSSGHALDTLKREKESIQKEFQREIEELRTSQESQRHQWLVREDTLKVEKSKLERQLDKAELVENHAKTKREELTKIIQDLENELQTSRSKQRDIEKNSQQNLQLIAHLRAVNEQQQSNIQNHELQRGNLQASLLSAQEQIGRLEERLKMAQQTITELRLFDEKTEV